MALLTVLMLVGVMGALTAVTLETMNRSLALAGNGRAAAQAHHYARGAALVAAERIESLTSQADGVLTLAGGWADEPLTVPTAGGFISVRISDASHCFNVNAVVAGTPGGALRIRPQAVQQFTGLAQGVGIALTRANAMAMALVDWIDSDTFPQGGGAEDGAYAGFRTPNGLVASPAELTAVANWSAEDYALIEPFLCALPTTDMQAINVNTLTDEDAPLLGMLVPRNFSVTAARGLIARRPPAGWDSRADFWSAALAIGAQPGARAQYQIAMDSDLFRADIDVDEGGFLAQESVLIRLGERGPQLLQRRWGGA
jgi:general secretion pathway protein K